MVEVCSAKTLPRAGWCFCYQLWYKTFDLYQFLQLYHYSSRRQSLTSLESLGLHLFRWREMLWIWLYKSIWWCGVLPPLFEVGVAWMMHESICPSDYSLNVRQIEPLLQQIGNHVNITVVARSDVWLTAPRCEGEDGACSTCTKKICLCCCCSGCRWGRWRQIMY